MMSWLKVSLKECYMLLISLISKVTPKKIKKGQVTYLYSFSGNNVDLIERMSALPEVSRVTILYTKNVADQMPAFSKKGITCIAINRPLFFCKGLQTLLQSQIVVLDNYFAFLGALTFTKATTKYQLWHANGAIKCFGWQDKKTIHRTKKEQARFQAVYDQTDYYVVGSQKMSQVFQASYQQPATKMLPIGLPRTDYFFEQTNKDQAIQRFKQKFPEAMGKKVVLYTPTYRDESQTGVSWDSRLPLFPKDYLVIAKLHPHALKETPEKATDVIYETRGLTLKELLFSVDSLITDYSSVPFEYCLANPVGHTLYYVFDQAAYQATVGIQADFFEKLEVATNQAELLAQLPGNAQATLKEWNIFNDGQATQRLLAHIKQHI